MAHHPLGDMDPEEFRREAHRIADWIADYLANPEQLPRPLACQSRRHRSGASRPRPRTQGESFDAILRDFERIILPGITHWNHPGFFAYFAITGSAPGILAEFLSAALNVQAMLWRTSPAATELEEVTLEVAAAPRASPDDFEGVIYDTASISTLHALAAARERCVPRCARRSGLGRPGRCRVYCSDQTHSSIDKAVILLGLGHDVAAQDSDRREFRMRADALAPQSRRIARRDWIPLAVVATVGTTSSTSVIQLRR